MRILIDLQGAQNGSRERGIGRYVTSFARAMARNRGRHDIRILLNAAFADHVEPLIAGFDGLLDRDAFVLFDTPTPLRELDEGNRWRVSAAEALYEHHLASLDIDVLVFGSLFEGAMDDSVVAIGPAPRPYHTAVVLHDLIPLIEPERYIGYPPAAAWYHRKVAQLRRADLLLSVSESARSEALEHLAFEPTRVTRIGAAASDVFHAARAAASDPIDTARLAALGIDRPFVMHASAFEYRKNFEGLVRAYARLPEPVRRAHQLVLVCKLDDVGREALQQLALAQGLADDEMVLTGFVPDADLIRLYTACRLFVFPSFHEGFGLPALEAMACGAATIGSRFSSVPEVIDWDDALFDPRSPEQMSAMIARGLTDDGYRRDLLDLAKRQAAAFCWDATARAAIAVLEALPAMPAVRPPAIRTLAERIARIAAEPADGDLPATAIAAARNEAAATLSRARAESQRRLTWRIEGPFDSSYSLALVNRETARALDRLGHDVVLHSTEGPGDIPVDPLFLDANPDLAAMHARSAAIPAADTEITSRNLYPPRVHDNAAPVTTLHHYPWEETGFPHVWVDQFNRHLSFLTVSSHHVRKLMIDNGVSAPIAVTGNGVDHWDRVTAAPTFPLRARTFRFLHVSSGFPRKGVDVLLDAYGDSFTIRDDVTLVLKTFANPHNTIRAMLDERREAQPDFPDVEIIEDDLDVAHLKALYAQCDVMVCPSRAEGFGLPLAESMMSGLPVITTAWSGQLDFCNAANAWLVDYRFARAETHAGLFASVWAEPNRADLAAALRNAHAAPQQRRRAMAAIGRAQLLADHRWSDVAARLVDAFHQHEAAPKRAVPRVGMITTWGKRCGIATYAAHLVRHMGGDVTVLAPAGDSTDGGADAVRCWRAGKHGDDYADLRAAITARDLAVVVIQFNYALYDHQALAALIDWAVDDGRVVIAILHSTVDPVVEIPGSELSRIAASLSRCARLLVHDVGDLNRLKAIGLSANAALFPHGCLSLPAAAPRGDTALPMVATFGFCLPHKGLVQIVEAAALLRDAGTPVRLRMLNARFPAPASDALAADIRARIVALGLGDLVDFRDDFIADDAALALLAEVDLVAYPYGRTGESASGAVRYGMASRRPVLVTDQPIFGDLGAAVLRVADNDPATLAEAIRSIVIDRRDIADVAAAAERWRDQHDYAVVGRRLTNICTALAPHRAVASPSMTPAKIEALAQ